MLFKELKQGYDLFIYNRSDVSVSNPKVTNVSVPHVDNSPQRYANNTGNMYNTSLVVDVEVEENGRKQTYTLTDTSEVAFSGDLVISTGREAILREIESTRIQMEQYLSKIEENKEKHQKSVALLAEFNPEFRSKKETQERFNKIEGDVKEIKGMMSEILDKLK